MLIVGVRPNSPHTTTDTTAKHAAAVSKTSNSTAYRSAHAADAESYARTDCGDSGDSGSDYLCRTNANCTTNAKSYEYWRA